MFDTQSSASTDLAGALGTQDINAYQAVGAVTALGVVSGSTLGMAIAAPLPILGTVAVSAGLMYYGTKIQKDAHAKRDADKADSSATPAAVKTTDSQSASSAA